MSEQHHDDHQPPKPIGEILAAEIRDEGGISRSNAMLIDQGIRDGWLDPYRITPETRQIIVDALRAMLERGVAKGSSRIVLRAAEAIMRLDTHNLSIASAHARAAAESVEAAKPPPTQQVVVVRFDDEG